MPNFARACGRVSIGGHPDKRPDSRPERDRDDRKVTGLLELRTLDWQPEAKPAHLVLHEGRGLKQRRSGLFWSLPVLHRPARATEEACFSLPRVRIGVSPIQSKAVQPGLEPSRRRVPIARRRDLEGPHHIGAACRPLRPIGEGAMTARIHEFLRNRTEDGPCLVVDLEIVRDNYKAFANALPDTRVFYAVKANPSPEVLSLLARLGSCFDTASVAEIEMVLAAGATPDRISYGNTIKKERDIARAFALGVRLFAVDCRAEVEKIARAAPGARVFCRFLFDCAGAEWPLSRKFGCDADMAVDVLEHAHRLGLEAHGVSFHVGSQQRRTQAWDLALKSAG